APPPHSSPATRTASPTSSARASRSRADRTPPAGPARPVLPEPERKRPIMNIATLTEPLAEPRTDTRRELPYPVSRDLEITLFWDKSDNSTSIDLRHDAIDETISFRVPPAKALEAFHHPFAHLRWSV